ncbi:MAG: hypothetical protein E3J66_04620, partial [Dehalococcoidia bacterium]
MSKTSRIMGRIVLTAMMVISLLTVFSPSVSASPGDIRVPEAYTTILQAIDNVDAENRTILVNALTYNATETVVVDESNIAIRSVNGSAVVTAGGAADHVFNITGQANVTLEGFEIRDANGGASRSVAGIWMNNATGCNISNIAVTNITTTGAVFTATGIRLSDSNNNTFGSSIDVS